ncbi:MAG: ABC transporter ATP-binding protein [Alphaproteobacteria bacterium]|nr:ABC transporter ATP-binding protein [Alphaproteobacteria bacterium]
MEAARVHAPVVRLADQQRSPLIAIKSVAKTYISASGSAVPALDNVALDIAPDEFVCIVGPSGCGKSTLLRLIAGLDRVSGGTITLASEPITGPSANVGVVFQSANLLPWMTVRDNVRLPLRVGGYRAKNEARIDALLTMVGLGSFGDKFPYELSGGMQQRVAICRALTRDPKILLMDEPFGALDALTRERMNVELQRIWQASGKTVVLITHSISEAVFLADRVVVMSARPGRILRDLKVGLDRPRAFNDVVGHPEYVKLTRTIRGLLDETEAKEDLLS